MGDIKKILIIEDNFDIAKAMSEVLSDMGFCIDLAADGKEGMDRLINHPLPHLIILDLFLPIMSGPEFRKRQMLIPHLAIIPVLVMSVDCLVKRRSAAMGVKHYLKKPFELNELIFKIALLEEREIA